MNKNRAKMPISQRAKQFAPFDAVVGLRTALREKERIKVEPKNISDDMENEINYKLKNLQMGDIATITYYDDKIQNYLKIKGEITSINVYKKELEIQNFKIKFNDIYEIKK